MPDLDSIDIEIQPDTVIQVGDTVTGIARMYTADGTDTLISSLPGDFEWGFVDLYANNHDSTFNIVNDS